MNIKKYETFMQKAIEEAKKAEKIGEIPIGAIIVKEGNVIATGYNKREIRKNALLHAEIEAINNACEKIGNWRLINCDLYVTLEPCPMCAGAIINSRIKKLIFGAKDTKAGSCGSVINLFELKYNHRPEVISGVMEVKCRNLLSNFFKNLRQNKS